MGAAEPPAAPMGGSLNLMGSALMPVLPARPLCGSACFNPPPALIALGRCFRPLGTALIGFFADFVKGLNFFWVAGLGGSDIFFGGTLGEEGLVFGAPLGRAVDAGGVELSERPFPSVAVVCVSLFTS